MIIVPRLLVTLTMVPACWSLRRPEAWQMILANRHSTKTSDPGLSFVTRPSVALSFRIEVMINRLTNLSKSIGIWIRSAIL